MTFAERYPVLLNVLVIAVTIVFVALSLVVGRARAGETLELEVGDIAPETMLAPRDAPVEDEAATEREREIARNNVPTEFKIDPLVAIEVENRLDAFFRDVEDGAFEPSDTPVIEPPMITLLGDNPLEVPLGQAFTDPGYVATSGEGDDLSDDVVVDTAELDINTAGAYGITYDVADINGLTAETVVRTIIVVDVEASTTTLVPPTTLAVEPTTPTTTAVPLRPIESQIESIQREYALYGDSVIPIIEQFNADVARREAGETEVFPLLRDQAINLAEAQMRDGIQPSELEDIQNALILQGSIFIRLPDLEPDQAEAVRRAVTEIVASTLQANNFIDDVATQANQDAAAAAVRPVEVIFFEQGAVITEGQPVTAVQLAALEELELLQPEQVTSRLAIIVLGGLAVLLAAFFLWRVAPDRWSQPRHFALLGILLVLAAATSRVPELLEATENQAIAYVIPAVMFGYMGAILYDPRTALLLAIPVATFTAISTGDPALTIFAAGATVVPVAFVSAVSSRRQLRLAVTLAALVLAPFAAAIAWLFLGAEFAVAAGLFGLAGGVIGGLVAQGLLSFLENTFRMTTTLTLLDLTDRNHPGLRLIEEKAPGTFNHCILVGTLAGKAARAIGADPLLAQAAAYYHDLGKTENPQFFIENQFGVSNPHDEIEPVQSAAIIRAHVIDGLRLARQLRIPDEVAAGIRMHHGTGLMRYFYHKALEDDPSIDPDDFRHHGVKPRRKEMAILMIADAVEGAARALAQHEDPTPASLSKLVDSIVGEKLEDGQLAESELTFGDLTNVKAALVDALIGYYHTRIAYPNFPGSQVS